MIGDSAPKPKNVAHSRLTDLMRLDLIQRWATVEVSRPQSVAEHSFRVAVLVDDFVHSVLGGYVFVGQNKGKLWLWENSRDALEFALVHDGAESRTGDINHLFKQYLFAIASAEHKVCPWLEEEPIPSLEVRAVVRLCDRLEGYLYLRHWGRATDPDLEFYLDGLNDQVVRATAEAAEELSIPAASLAAWVKRVTEEVR